MSKRDRLALILASGWNELAVRDAVLETRLSRTEKLVLLALVSHAGDQRIAGAPDQGLSVRRVGALASVHKDTPGRVFARLECAGLVRVLRDPRDRHADRFDLSRLPLALSQLLSAHEGQPVSGLEGQGGKVAESDCPSEAANAVPPEPAALSGLEGPKGSVEGISEGISSTPRRSAADSGPALVLESPEPKPKKPPKPKNAKKRERTRTDAEVANQKAILDAYSAAVLAKTSAAPSIGSREAGAAWRVLDWCKADGPRAVALVRGAVAREFGGTTSLNVIASDPNKFLGAAKPPKTNGQAPKQPNAGFWALPTEHLA